MPVVSTATSVSVVPMPVGQRAFSEKLYPIDARQKIWVNIQDTSAVIKVFETVEELSFSLEQIVVDEHTNAFSTGTTFTFSDPDIVTGTKLEAIPLFENGILTGMQVTTTGTGYCYKPTWSINDPENPNANTSTNLQLLIPPNKETAEVVTNTYERGSITIPLSRLKTEPQFDSQTLWAFDTEVFTIDDNQRPQRPDVNLDHITYLGRPSLQPFDRSFKVWYFKRPYPVFVRSAQRKGLDLTSTEFNYYGNQPPLFYFFVHDKNSESMRDFTWQFNYHYDSPASSTFIGPSAADFKSTVTNTSMAFEDLIEDIYLKVPDEDIPAGSPVPVEIHTSPFIKEAYVEQVCGTLDRTKVTLIDGVGRFNILTNTLQPGEVAAAKVGFKYWVNFETVTKTLT
jgi:hypothetical protein